MRPGTHCWHRPGGAALDVSAVTSPRLAHAPLVPTDLNDFHGLVVDPHVRGEVALFRLAPPSGSTAAKRATSRSLYAKEAR
jgi:hypothetical protein